RLRTIAGARNMSAVDERALSTKPIPDWIDPSDPMGLHWSAAPGVAARITPIEQSNTQPSDATDPESSQGPSTISPADDQPPGAAGRSPVSFDVNPLDHFDFASSLSAPSPTLAASPATPSLGFSLAADDWNALPWQPAPTGVAAAPSSIKPASDVGAH